MAEHFSHSLSLRAVFLLLIVEFVCCDIYLHNPRGSNDRLDSTGVNRQNANRLFNSQNNAKGGYNVGELPDGGTRGRQDLQYAMKYFQSGRNYLSSRGKAGKSRLIIEWTNQHGCGHRDLNCNIVLQYMCQKNTLDSLDDRNNNDYDVIRNGRVESTIRYTNIRSYSSKTVKDNIKRRNANLKYGMHEPWEAYDKCRKRERNKGLFTADQNVQDNAGSTKTRQNPNGNRYGYECPEERDYFPYWYPTDWKDAAVFANSRRECLYYRVNSFNRRPKGECLDIYPGGGLKHYSKHNNQKACEKANSTWVKFYSYIDIVDKNKRECRRASTRSVPLVWGIPYDSNRIDKLQYNPNTKEVTGQKCLVQPPRMDCFVSPLSRPNHLGNVRRAKPMRYTWAIPYFPSNEEKRCAFRIRYNISTGDYRRYRTFSDKNGAKSPVKNDPAVKFDTTLPGVNFNLQLAVNTAQFGRTFQDRSHVMILMPRKAAKIPDKSAIYNLNVRGKRGNIVQAYPAVEYDFIPKLSVITEDDILHIQWTGSSKNPRNNAGEGEAGTDKNNLVEIEGPAKNVKIKNDGTMISKATLVWSPDKNLKTLEAVKVALASSGFDFSRGKEKRIGQIPGVRPAFQNQLNNSPASFSVALSFSPGIYHFMCTRNNNFTNRNQKASLVVFRGCRCRSHRYYRRRNGK